MELEELQKLEKEVLLAALKRKDMRTVKAIVTLALLRPLPETPKDNQ